MSNIETSHLNSVMMTSKSLGLFYNSTSNEIFEAVEITIYASYRRDYVSTEISNDTYIANGGNI